MLDCSFVTIDSVEQEHEAGGFLDGLLPATNSSRGVGYVFFEDEFGECYYDHLDEEAREKDIFEQYIVTFLGGGWNKSRAMGFIAVGLTWALFLWSMFFSCIAHPRAIRYTFVAMLLVVILFQGLTFFPFVCDFCEEYACQFSRGGIYVVVSVSLLFISAILMVLALDYPGDAFPFYTEKMSVRSQTGEPVVSESMVRESPSPEDEGEQGGTDDAAPSPAAKELPAGIPLVHVDIL